MYKILIVEDNEMNRDMLTRRLERRGFKIVTAANGKEGIEKARSESPDLILMDMSLPVMDGWEAAHQLKGDETLKGIPIIALTAHAMLEDLNLTLEAGCNDYDTKPIDFTRLLEKIRRFLPVEKKV